MAGRPIPPTQLAHLIHSLATRQSSDRAVAAWLLKMFCDLNASTQAGAITEVGAHIDELPRPWPAFRIEVPAGLIPSPKKCHDAFVSTIDVAQSVSMRETICWDWTLRDTTKHNAQIFSDSTQHGLEHSPLRDDFEELIAKDSWREADGLSDRLSVVVVRLVRGLLATMQEPAAIRRTRKEKRTNKWRMSKAPETEEYVVGRDVEIKIDCTGAVSSFVRAERRGMPTIQWPVRGHWRQQACGPGLVDRRRTWIQPHWKGPEHTTRLVRRQVMSGSATGLPDPKDDP